MGRHRRHDHTLLILGLALALVCSPFSDWWTALGPPWWAMFAPWALIVALVAANGRGR